MAFQISASLLDACVLAVLDKSDVYGYELTQKLKDVIGISESTLYPVLRRLQKEELVTAYDMPFNGRNRRYYSITQSGNERLLQYKVEWNEYKDNVDRIMAGEFHNEQR